MIRLRNPDVSEVHRIVEKYNLAAQGISGPYVGAYTRSFGQQHFAAEDLVNSILVILGSPVEGVKSREELAGAGVQTDSQREEGIDLNHLPPVLDRENVTRADATHGGEACP